MSIYVGNLSYEVTQDQLTQTLQNTEQSSRFSCSKTAKQVVCRGFAFVEMGTEAEEAATEALDGAGVDGRDLKVKAKPREERIL